MFKRKIQSYTAAEKEELAAQGIRYLPVVYSAYGREHPETMKLLNGLARWAARKFGVKSGKLLRCRNRARIGIALVSRHAAMIQACQHCSAAAM